MDRGRVPRAGRCLRLLERGLAQGQVLRRGQRGTREEAIRGGHPRRTATRSKSIRGTARRDTSWPRRIRASGDPQNAAREYINAAELLPDNLDAQLNAARYLLLGREFDRAKSHASRVVQIDPKNVEGHILLGSAIAGLKDLTGAMKEIEEAIELAPTSSVGYTNKAALLLEQGRKQDALANFQKAVEIDPKSLGAYLALASYHWTTGAIPEAEKAMKDALALDPQNATANRALALLYMSTGRAAEAEPYVKTTVKTVGTPEAELSLADYYLSVNRTKDATPILERLASGESTAAAAGVRLARLDYATGNKTAAHTRLDASSGQTRQ